MNPTPDTAPHLATLLKRGYLYTLNGRSVVVAPLKRPHHTTGTHELTALWCMSLDGLESDALARDEAHARSLARKALMDPALECWISRPGAPDTALDPALDTPPCDECGADPARPVETDGRNCNACLDCVPAVTS